MPRFRPSVWFLTFSLLLVAALPAAADPPATLQQRDEFTLVGALSFLDGYPALAGEDAVHVVVEIPAGTNAKWEVRKPDGALAWEFRDGRPRVVEYLPYPANYGMIPSTLLPREQGGDGDPLDVILLGPALERGSVVTARPVGILRLLDGGELDDKILAISEDCPLDASRARSPEELRTNYPGLLEILELWFHSYKGPGEIESKGYGGVEEAWERIHSAASAHRETVGR